MTSIPLTVYKLDQIRTTLIIIWNLAPFSLKHLADRQEFICQENHINCYNKPHNDAQNEPAFLAGFFKIM
jgi:hypothetical protein